MNNREIKFRAWDKSNKEMMSSEEVSDWPIKELYESGYFVPMQFTGLKDKNGKEIYEGDIVKCIMKVYEKEGWVGKEWVNARVTIDSKYGIQIDQKRWESAKNIEIIGNLYQNPELIK